MNRFTLIRRLPHGGHRLFWDKAAPGRIAIADDSGSTPDQTDDGVLYLDTDRPIQLGYANQRYCVTVPLLRPDGSKTRTPSSFAGALILASDYADYGVHIEFETRGAVHAFSVRSVSARKEG